jgi:hypothetical protein
MITHAMLRIFSVSAMALVTLWALSPLGGQGALRMLTVRSHISDSIATTLWYLSSSIESPFSSGSGSDRAVNKVNALYVSNMFIPEDARNASQDIFGNIKIPMIEELSLPAGEGGWLPVENNTVVYSSLLGIPIAGLPTTGFVNFTMDSSYMRLDCVELEEISRATYNSTYGKDYGGLLDNAAFFYTNFVFKTAVEDQERDYDESIMNKTSLPARNLIFISGTSDETFDAFNYARCLLSLSHVESRVLCEGKRCYVAAMRRSLLPQTPANLTFFDGTGIVVEGNYFSDFTNATGHRSSGDECTPTERYIHDPNTAFVSDHSDCVDLFSVPRDVFSLRLGLLMNTYWIAADGLGRAASPPLRINAD